MNLFTARDLACTLMRQYGLHDWEFRFDHARRRFGSCRCQSKRITLSKPLTFLNPESQVRDTILHEIAHALTPGDGHGQRWKAMCRQIGANPQRCYDEGEVIAPPRDRPRYRMGCTRCGWWVERRRLSHRKLVCRQCRQAVVFEPAGCRVPGEI
jgi:predicted SprT family Zn-dependent metalloprotease